MPYCTRVGMIWESLPRQGRPRALGPRGWGGVVGIALRVGAGAPRRRAAHSPRPRRQAHTAAWVRSETPNLAKMCLRWVLTVLREMCNRSAIS